MKEPNMYRGKLSSLNAFPCVGYDVICSSIGVNCRFGMKGVTAAAHYDSRRNYIAMIRGRKR